jgi:hypothetical protein
MYVNDQSQSRLPWARYLPREVNSYFQCFIFTESAKSGTPKAMARAKLGVDPSTLVRWERGEREAEDGAIAGCGSPASGSSIQYRAHADGLGDL